MKRQLLALIFAVTVGSFAFAQDDTGTTGNIGGQGGKRQYYRIVKVQTLEDIPAGSTFVGHVPGNICGITGFGDALCVVVTAEPPAGFQEGKVIPGTETFYYLATTNRGGRQVPNFVTYIESEEKVMPGSPAVGVYKANN